MSRRTWVAVALSFALVLVWQQMTAPKGTPPDTTAQSAPAAQPLTQVADALKPENTAKIPKRALEKIEVQARDSQPQIGTGVSFFSDWKLRGYQVGKNEGARPVDLSAVTHELGALRFAVDSPEFEYLSVSGGESEPIGEIVSRNERELRWKYEDEHVLLERHYQFSEEQAFVDVVVSARFKTKHPKFAFLSLLMQGRDDDPEAADRMVAAWTKDEIERHLLSDTVPLKEVAEPVKWIGALSRYFTLAVVPKGSVPAKGLVQPHGYKGGRVSLVYPMQDGVISIPLRVYFGAKDLAVLHEIDPTLDHTVDFGWFTIVAYPLLRLMKWFYSFTENYGVAIILLTVLVKILTFPLTYKSMKSMKQMATLQPQLKKLQEKYANDREQLNREMLTFMRSHGYNPLAGCWPILIQMPVFFALYRVLYGSVELYQAPFAFWLHDLSDKDPFYVMPVLVSLTWFYQQKLTPQTTMDPTQQKIMQYMPIVFGVFMLTLPAGLGIYFLVNAVLSIFQQIILNKKFQNETPAGARNGTKAAAKA